MTRNVGVGSTMETFCVILRPMEAAGTIADLPALFRPRDLETQGISRDILRGMVRRGEVMRMARGLYRVTEAPLSEHETRAAVCKLVPGAVICLLSALAFHGIGTQLPHQVWIGIDRKARRPKAGGLKIRVVRFTPAMQRYGIETHKVLGVSVRVTSPARTVADCFRFLDTVGLDVAIEALKDAVHSKRVRVQQLDRAAEAIGANEKMGPYLEAILA